jgi:hypothetical protein
MEVSRSDFIRMMSRAGVVDPHHVSPELKAELDACGITTAQLGDHVLRNVDDYNRLYDAISTASQNAPSATRATTSAPALEKSSELYRLRAPFRLELDNPLTSSSANSSVYALGPRALGYALDRFAERYPALDKNFAARFLQLSLAIGGEVPWMTLSHEAGHNRVASSFGWNPTIHMTGWMSGLTDYGLPQGVTPTPDQDLIISTAGVNQEQLNAAYLYSDWARNGSVRYSEAMAYLLAQTNTGLYALRTATRPGIAPPSDDINAYAQGLTARGQRITAGQIAAIAVASDLLSAPVLASIYGQARFLVNGDNKISIPRFAIGPVEATFPNFHTYLTTNGPIVGGQLFVNPEGRVPLELSLDVAIDGHAAAAGAKLYDVHLFDNVAINPFLRTSASPLGLGILIGSDLRVDLDRHLSVIGTAAIGQNDLFNETEMRKNGLRLGISIGFTP